MAVNGINSCTSNVYFAIHLLFIATGYISSYCVMPNNLPNGRIIYGIQEYETLKKAPEKYVLRFRCSKGYTLIGSRVILCNNTIWSERIPTCLKRRCENPPDVPHGQYSLKRLINGIPGKDSKAIYTCKDGYHLESEAASILTCTGNLKDISLYWRGRTPRCLNDSTCSDPGVSLDGTRTGNCCSVGSILRFSCKDDYELVGEITIECLPSRTWNFQRPLCRPPDGHCNPPPEIVNGILEGDKQGDYYRSYEEVEIFCDSGFFHYGKAPFIMCEEDGHWEEDFGICRDYSSCGRGPIRPDLLRPGIITGGMAREPWPWMASIFFGKDKASEGLVHCGASIINPKFVLSAAHCFISLKHGTFHKISDILVTAGLTNLRDQKYQQLLEVQNLFLHPQYDSITFDYDIILVQLSTAIRFNYFANAVCLPPKTLPPGSQLYKRGRNAVATGWGATVLNGKFTDRLKEMILPIQSKRRCRESALRNNIGSFSDRMLCAGDGMGGDDPCMGDSGGPLMQPQLNSNGDFYWTQIGVISWGIGCKLSGNFAYFTHVKMLLSWIRSTINETEF